MKIIEKLKNKALHLNEASPVAIAFLGDSVTQGCFDIYPTGENSLETYFDAENGYHAQLRKMLGVLYPNVPVNIINAGISGDNAPSGLRRLERDVLRFSPDLCVVCFGLNDACNDVETSFEDYKLALEKIIDRLQKDDIEVILLTPNMMCTNVSCHLENKLFRSIAANAAEVQTSGKFDEFLDAAKTIAEQKNIPICDCYAKWKCLYDNGVNTTELLANHINHPIPEMNKMFAAALLETMFTTDL